MVLFNFNGKALPQLLQGEAQLLRAQLEPHSASPVSPDVWVPKISLNEQTKRVKKIENRKETKHLPKNPTKGLAAVFLAAGRTTITVNMSKHVT